MAQLATLLFHGGGNNEIFAIVLQSNNCPLFSRLFYLHQNMVKFISEEGVFMCLTWFHPTLCGIIVSMLLGENFLLDSNKTSTTYFFYSLCSKVIFHKEEFMQTTAVYMFTLSSTSIVFATVVTHIALLIRHRQLKKQRADGTKVVTYSAKDGTLNSTRGEIRKTFFLNILHGAKIPI